MTSHKSLIAIAAGVVSLLAPVAASAGPFLACNGKPVRLPADPVTQLSSISFPAGSQVRADIETAIAQWNNLQGSEREFAPLREFAGSSRMNNGQNEIVLTNVPGRAPLGLTFLTYGTCTVDTGELRIEEFDIEIAGNQLSLLGAPPEDTNRTASIRQTMMHELGHALGLQHVGAIGRPSVMEMAAPGGWFGGAPATRVHPFGDDAATARFLYPADETHTDVAATAFEVRPFDNASTTTMARTTLVVPRGQTLVARGGIDNLGNTTETFDFVYVLSDNDVIAATDPVVASGTATLAAGEFQVLSLTARVPEDLPAGFYRLGLILDPNNDVGELLEGNNTVVLSTRVQVP